MSMRDLLSDLDVDVAVALLEEVASTSSLTSNDFGEESCIYCYVSDDEYKGWRTRRDKDSTPKKDEYTKWHNQKCEAWKAGAPFNTPAPIFVVSPYPHAINCLTVRVQTFLDKIHETPDVHRFVLADLNSWGGAYTVRPNPSARCTLCGQEDTVYLFVGAENRSRDGTPITGCFCIACPEQDDPAIAALTDAIKKDRGRL